MTHAQPGSADVLTRPDTEAVAGITRSGRDVDRVVDGLRHFRTPFTAYHDTERSKPGHVPFSELKGRRFEKPNVNLVQHYGRFLAVPGRRIRDIRGAVPCRDESVVKSPEVGGLPGVSIRDSGGLSRRLVWKGVPPFPGSAPGETFPPARPAAEGR
ncbi:hypothetical protein AB0E27_43185 [Streptomyces sparsogenes]|uniref:hypothetical protein n=1 Tax=Streptomyces sparsogenes TaxID=67365 RepID=UPI0033D5ACCE